MGDDTERPGASNTQRLQRLVPEFGKAGLDWQGELAAMRRRVERERATGGSNGSTTPTDQIGLAGVIPVSQVTSPETPGATAGLAPVAAATQGARGAAPSRGRQFPRNTVASLGYPEGIGEYAYLTTPSAIVAAIGRAEDRPSYGNQYLLRKYGSHTAVPENEGRAATAKLVHQNYRAWVSGGRPGDFLDYLRDHYAPIGAKNDPPDRSNPYGRNFNWLPNVLWFLPQSIKVGAVYGTASALEAERAIAAGRIAQRSASQQPTTNFRGR